MGTIAQKLEAANNSKKAIKTAIEAKGVVVGDAPLKDYASKIESISAGGSSFDAFVEDKGYNSYRKHAEEWLRKSYEITGDLKIVNNGQFKGNKTLVSIPDGTTLKAGTNTLGYCWQDCKSLQFLDLSNWDVSNVTALFSCWSGCASLQSLDLSNWSVGNVGSLLYCWGSCQSLQFLDLSNWDVSNVTVFTGSFNQCYGLIHLKCFINAKLSFALTHSNLLTRESLLSVLQAPAIVTTTQTLSLHDDTKVLITTAQSNVSAGTADELDTQIANEVTNVINKGWTIA